MFAKSFEIKEKEVKRESSDYTTDIRSNDPINYMQFKYTINYTIHTIIFTLLYIWKTV